MDGEAAVRRRILCCSRPACPLADAPGPRPKGRLSSPACLRDYRCRCGGFSLVDELFSPSLARLTARSRVGVDQGVGRAIQGAKLGSSRENQASSDRIEAIESNRWVIDLNVPRPNSLVFFFNFYFAYFPPFQERNVQGLERHIQPRGLR